MMIINVTALWELISIVWKVLCNPWKAEIAFLRKFMMKAQTNKRLTKKGSYFIFNITWCSHAKPKIERYVLCKNVSNGEPTLLVYCLY